MPIGHAEYGQNDTDGASNGRLNGLTVVLIK